MAYLFSAALSREHSRAASTKRQRSPPPPPSTSPAVASRVALSLFGSLSPSWAGQSRWAAAATTFRAIANDRRRRRWRRQPSVLVYSVESKAGEPLLLTPQMTTSTTAATTSPEAATASAAAALAAAAPATISD